MGLIGPEQGKVEAYKQVTPRAYDVDDYGEAVLVKNIPQNEYDADGYYIYTLALTGLTSDLPYYFRPRTDFIITYFVLAQTGNLGAGSWWYLYHTSAIADNVIDYGAPSALAHTNTYDEFYGRVLPAGVPIIFIPHTTSLGGGSTLIIKGFYKTN